MSFTSCLSDAPAVLVLDASVVVNLNATGCADEIIGALGHSCIVTDNVLRELELGSTRGYTDAAQLKRLRDNEVLDIVSLDANMNKTYLELVAGSTVDTLDDGEAATLAYADGDSAWAAIDERKALRICRERFASVQTASTVDLLAHPSLTTTLESTELGNAVYNALVNANMRVFEHQLGWVVDLVGRERAKQCPSLPGRHRFGLEKDRSS